MEYEVVSKNDVKLREDAMKVYEFILNHFKFRINQKDIEFDCSEIEYSALTYTGVLILDDFLIPVTPTVFYLILKNYIIDDKNKIKSKKAILVITFINYLIKKGLVL